MRDYRAFQFEYRDDGECKVSVDWWLWKGDYEVLEDTFRLDVGKEEYIVMNLLSVMNFRLLILISATRSFRELHNNKFATTIN